MNGLNRSVEETSVAESEKQNIEVWEDIVSIKDMVMSLFICSAATLGAYFLSPKEPPKPLFFGLSGAILGFIVCTLIVKPKREFIEENQEE